MATPDSELRSYDELIGSLESKVGDLSAVHQGLAEAARTLVVANRELDEVKRGIDLLAGSSQGILDEVRRLKPDELGAALDSSLSRLSRETAEGQGALSERLVALAAEATRGREEAEERFARLAKDLDGHEAAAASRLSDAQGVLTDASVATRRAVADAQQATERALVVLRDRHESRGETLAAVQRRQGDLGQRLDALPPLLMEIQRQQAVLAQRLASLAAVTDGIGPAVTSAMAQTRHDLVTEIARSRRWQIVAFVVLLVAIGLVWAAQAGLLPSP